MAGSEEFYGEGHDATRTKQPKITTRHAEFSEIAHHKDGDANHGFTVPIESDTPWSHEHDHDR